MHTHFDVSTYTPTYTYTHIQTNVVYVANASTDVFTLEFVYINVYTRIDIPTCSLCVATVSCGCTGCACTGCMGCMGCMGCEGIAKGGRSMCV